MITSFINYFTALIPQGQHLYSIHKLHEYYKQVCKEKDRLAGPSKRILQTLAKSGALKDLQGHLIQDYDDHRPLGSITSLEESLKLCRLFLEKKVGTLSH